MRFDDICKERKLNLMNNYILFIKKTFIRV